MLPVVPSAVNSTLYPERSWRRTRSRHPVAPRSCPPRTSAFSSPPRYPFAGPVHSRLFCRFSILFFSTAYKSPFPQAVCFLIYLHRRRCGGVPIFRPFGFQTSRHATIAFSTRSALFFSGNRSPSFVFSSLQTLFAHIGGGTKLWLTTAGHIVRGRGRLVPHRHLDDARAANDICAPTL
jgi:hypothetical protein